MNSGKSLTSLVPPLSLTTTVVEGQLGHVARRRDGRLLVVRGGGAVGVRPRRDLHLLHLHAPPWLTRRKIGDHHQDIADRGSHRDAGAVVRAPVVDRVHARRERHREGDRGLRQHRGRHPHPRPGRTRRRVLDPVLVPRHRDRVVDREGDRTADSTGGPPRRHRRHTVQGLAQREGRAHGGVEELDRLVLDVPIGADVGGADIGGAAQVEVDAAVANQVLLPGWLGVRVERHAHLILLGGQRHLADGVVVGWQLVGRRAVGTVADALDAQQQDAGLSEDHRDGGHWRPAGGVAAAVDQVVDAVARQALVLALADGRADRGHTIVLWIVTVVSLGPGSAASRAGVAAGVAGGPVGVAGTGAVGVGVGVGDPPGVAVLVGAPVAICVGGVATGTGVFVGGVATAAGVFVGSGAGSVAAAAGVFVGAAVGASVGSGAGSEVAVGSVGGSGVDSSGGGCRERRGERLRGGVLLGADPPEARGHQEREEPRQEQGGQGHHAHGLRQAPHSTRPAQHLGPSPSPAPPRGHTGAPRPPREQSPPPGVPGAAPTVAECARRRPYAVDRTGPPGRPPAGPAARYAGGDGGEGRGGGRRGGRPLDPAAVRALPADAFAALLLRLGRYRVDPATGAVVSAHTGRPMAPQRNPQTGYLQVLLSFTRWPRGRSPCTAWWPSPPGAPDAVRGRHVVHRDGDRAHNAAANLALVDPPPRNRHPGPGAPAPAGPPAAPCARCGTTGGTVRTPGRPPRHERGAVRGGRPAVRRVLHEPLAPGAASAGPGGGRAGARASRPRAPPRGRRR